MSIILELARFMARKGVFNFIPDKTYLKLKYRVAFHKRLDLKNPCTFNEKLQWLKLYHRDPVLTTMVDKYEAKEYVSHIIGNQYIIPTFGVWDRFEDIDFNKLPDQFVLKCTHDCGSVVICKNKSTFNINSAKETIEKSLNKNYYYVAREWPYKNVKPRIIAEKYLETKGGGIEDYKLWCFNGEPKFTLVCTGRFSGKGTHEDFFDMEWEHLSLKRPASAFSEEKIPCPKNYPLMKELARKLSKNMPFVRVDFYECDGNIYFGELTLFSAGGFAPFEPEEWDAILGSWLTLPKRDS